MMMRKRAWDLMRDDFTTIVEDAGLVNLIRSLSDAVDTDSDNHVAVVLDEHGGFKGVISMWSVMRKLEKCVFSDEVLLAYTDGDWDRAFARACRACADKGIDGLLEEDPPIAQPNDPLVVVMENFLNHRRGWVLVMEGGKVLGVILKSDIFKEVSRDVLAQMT